MRYEHPLYLAEEAASLDLLADGRVSLGVSRGSPEPAQRGWESFGYRAEAPNGADLARAKFETFLNAIDGYGVATAAPAEEQYPRMYQAGTPLPVFPHSPRLRRNIWWGAGHDWTPRVSVSRSVFPIVDDRSRELFGLQATGRDQIGSLGEGTPVTFGRTYAAEPDQLIEQLRADAAVMAADTLMNIRFTGVHRSRVRGPTG